jgi:hypothetical protein
MPLPPSLCPRCGYLDTVGLMSFSLDAPKRGDFSVCLNCGAINRLDETLRLVVASDADVAAIHPVRQFTLRAAQRHAQQRGPIMKKETPS